MSPIHLVSASLFAIAIPAFAQTPASTPVPVPSHAARVIAVVPTNPLRPIPVSKTATLTAQLNAPCFTIRRYGFTSSDRQFDSPRPSTYSTCTPARPNAVLQVAAPAKLTPVK